MARTHGLTMRRAASFALVSVLVATLGMGAAIARDDVVWKDSVGRRLSEVATDARGNVVAVGQLGRYGRRQALIVSWGPHGGVRWRRSWDPAGPRTDAAATAVAVAPGGRVFVAGEEAVTSCEGGGWFVSAYTRHGRLLWHGEERGWRRCRTADRPTGLDVRAGLLAMSGFSYGCCDSPFHEGWVKAFSTDGRGRWTNPFEVPGLPDTYDRAWAVAVSALGRVYTVGAVATRIDDPNRAFPDEEVIVQKIASGGSTLWTRVLRRRGDRDLDTATGVAVRGQGVVVTAHLNYGRLGGGSPADRFGGRGSAWLGRFDVGGGLRWSRTWGTTQRKAQEATGVAFASDGTIVVGGDARNASGGLDPYWRRYSPGGRRLHTATLRTEPRYVFATGVVPVGDGVALVGYRAGTKYGGEGRGKIWWLREA